MIKAVKIAFCMTLIGCFGVLRGQAMDCIKVFSIPFNVSVYSPTSLSPATLGDQPSFKLCDSAAWSEFHSVIKRQSLKGACGFEERAIRMIFIVDAHEFIYVDRNGIVKDGDSYYLLDKDEMSKLIKKYGGAISREF
jgi:hypothetical protein